MTWWQIVLIILISIILGLVVGYFLSYLIVKLLLKRPFTVFPLRERKVVAVAGEAKAVEEPLKPATPSLLAELVKEQQAKELAKRETEEARKAAEAEEQKRREAEQQARELAKRETEEARKAAEAEEQERREAAAVEGQPKATVPNLLAEVENNKMIANEPWTGKLIPFQTSVWNTSPGELSTLPANLREHLAQVYSDIQLANSIVWLGTELGRRSSNLDENYTKLCTNIAARLETITPLLKQSSNQ